MRTIIATYIALLAGCQVAPVDDRPQYLTAAEREPFIKGSYSTCLANQRDDALAKHWSSEQREQFCTCAATRSAETITLKEIGAFIRTQQKEDLKPHHEAVGKYCAEKLYPIWLAPLLPKRQPGAVHPGYSEEEIQQLLRQNNLAP
jgi:hypothetical protein